MALWLQICGERASTLLRKRHDFRHDRAAIGPRSGHDRATIGPRSGRDRATIGPRSGRDRATIGPRSGHDRATIVPRSGHNVRLGQLSVVVRSSGGDSAAEGATIAV